MESCVTRGEITRVVWSCYEITAKKYLLHGLMKIRPLDRIQCPKYFEFGPKSKYFLTQSQVLQLEYCDGDGANGTSKGTGFFRYRAGRIRSSKSCKALSSQVDAVYVRLIPAGI